MSHTVPPLNNLSLVGYLTTDPVLRTLSHDRKVCDMRIAVHDKRDPSPLFLDIATFGASAEACAEYLTRGRAVAFTGRLVYREWQAEDGSRRSKYQAVGRVQFGAPRTDASSEESVDVDEQAF